MKRYLIIVFCCFCKTVMAQSAFQLWEREALAKSVSWSYYTRTATAPNYQTYTSLYINGRPIASFSDAGTCRSKITELKRLAEQIYNPSSAPKQLTKEYYMTGKSKAEVDAMRKGLKGAIDKGSNAKPSQELLAQVEGSCSCRTEQNPNYKPNAKPYDNNNDLFETTDSNKSDVDDQSNFLFGKSTQYENIFDAPSARNRPLLFDSSTAQQSSVSLNFNDMEKYYLPEAVLDVDNPGESVVDYTLSTADIQQIIESCINRSNYFCDCVQSNFTALTGKHLDGKNAQIKSKTDIANNRMFNEYLREIYSGLDDYAETQKKDAEEEFREKNKHFDMAQISNYVYRDPESKLPEGWEKATGLTGNTQAVLDGFNSEIQNDGFYAEIYCKNCNNKENMGTKEYVVAFRGTEKDIKDVIVDLGQSQGSTLLSGQYYKAQDLVVYFKNNCEDCSISITGHSLGGGLASAAGLVTGLPTYTFNAAGVHGNTILKDHRNKLGQKNENIKAYYTENDPLSWVQDNPQKVAAIAEGAKITLNTIPGAEAFLKYYYIQPIKNDIREKTDLETSMEINKNIDKTLKNPISTFLSLPSALGNRIPLSDTGCEGIGCGHRMGEVIKQIEAPLKNEKTQIDISKENLKMTLSNCAASE